MQHFKTLVALLWCVLSSSLLQAQGWSSGSYTAGGDPPAPFSNDGNYVGGLTEFVNGQMYAATNYPGGTVEFWLQKFQFEEGWRGSCSIRNPSDLHTIARSAAQYAPNEVAVLTENVTLTSNTRTWDLAAFKFTLPAAPNCIDELWRINLPTPPNAGVFPKTLLSDGNAFWTLATLQANAASASKDVLLVKVGVNGTVLWTRAYPTPSEDNAVDMVQAPNGQLFILKQVVSTTGQSQAWLIHVDPDGNPLGEYQLSTGNTDIPLDLAYCADGGLLLTGMDANDPNRFYVQKSAANGSLLWRHDNPTTNQRFLPYAVLENTRGEVVMGGTLEYPNGEKDGYLVKCDAMGLPIWDRKIGRVNRPETLTKMVLSPDGGYALGGKYLSQGVNHSYVVKTDSNGIIKPSLIHGNVFRDFDMDCAQSADDQPLANWRVRAVQDSIRTFWADTDSLGNYAIECDTGLYLVELLRPSPYWTVCQNLVPVNVSYLDTAKVDFAVNASITCPYMQVEHATLRVRPCDTTHIALRYCNLGTDVATNASLRVDLDSLFSFVSASVPPTSISGNTLTFDLGNLPALHCGDISIQVSVSCAAVAGQIACSEVHAFPDTLCLPPPGQWSGAFIQVKAGSDGENVDFELKNTGTQTSDLLEYIVIEDAVLLRTGNFQLGPGQAMHIKERCNGRTLRLWANQEPNAPGNSIPTAAVEGCLGNASTPSFGFFNQSPQNDANPAVSNFCLPVVNSFDPNDKQGFPTGFGEQHNIFANTDLEYMIRFQNTGTDTAFRVVLLDTLSTYLDISTLQPSTSSHPYTFNVEDNGVLRFSFRNIKLPHAAVDEPRSNGFVTFRISQKRNNPVGTRIENRAGIYFDYNAPILTNTVFHTIHAPWLRVVSVQGPQPSQPLRIHITPNPFADRAVLTFEGLVAETATLRLYAADGTLVRTLNCQGNQATLERGSLPTGLYFFTLESQGRFSGSGRLIAE